MKPSPSPIRVLVVDDSAVVRKMMRELLSASAGFATETAADGFIAMKKVATNPPDVLLLDLEMPRIDGLTFLKRLMVENPLPVVICSSYAASGTFNAIEALREGAFDIVPKPTMIVGGFLQETRDQLVGAVRAAATSTVRRRASTIQWPLEPTKVLLPPTRRQANDRRVIAIGASTGGPQALETILGQMPIDAPPILVVQHMPEPFARAFTHRLNQACRITIRRAEPGLLALQSTVLISPGDQHLEVVNSGAGLLVRLLPGPPIAGHCPSVDALFSSVAKAAGPGSVGVILTGMGADGAEGLLAMKNAGMHTLAQDKASSAVYGMPRAAVARGAAMHVCPLSKIAMKSLTLFGSRSLPIPQ